MANTNPWEILWEDYYEILQVHPNASTEVIEAAYRRLARRYHSDVTHGSDEPMRRLNAAKDVLANPEQRAEYDREWRRRQADSAFSGNGRSSDDAGFDYTPPKPPPHVTLSPASVSLTDIAPGKRIAGTIRAENTGSPCTQPLFRVRTPSHPAHPQYSSSHWLSLQQEPSPLGATGSTTFTLVIDACRFDLGRKYDATVYVDYCGEEVALPVSVATRELPDGFTEVSGREPDLSVLAPSRLSTPWKVLLGGVGVFAIIIIGLVVHGANSSSSPRVLSSSAVGVQQQAPTVNQAQQQSVVTQPPAPAIQPAPVTQAPTAPPPVIPTNPPQPPPPTVAPFTGTGNFTGKVPSQPPGLLIQTGAIVTSIVDAQTKADDVYDIDLPAGGTLTIGCSAASEPKKFPLVIVTQPKLGNIGDGGVGNQLVNDECNKRVSYTAAISGRYHIVIENRFNSTSYTLTATVQ